MIQQVSESQSKRLLAAPEATNPCWWWANILEHPTRLSQTWSMAGRNHKLQPQTTKNHLRPNIWVSEWACAFRCVYLSGLVGLRWEELDKGSSRQGWSWLLLTVQMEEPLSLPSLFSLWALALLLPCQEHVCQDYALGLFKDFFYFIS